MRYLPRTSHEYSTTAEFSPVANKVFFINNVLSNNFLLIHRGAVVVRYWGLSQITETRGHCSDVFFLTWKRHFYMLLVILVYWCRTTKSRVDLVSPSHPSATFLVVLCLPLCLHNKSFNGVRRTWGCEFAPSFINDVSCRILGIVTHSTSLHLQSVARSSLSWFFAMPINSVWK